MQVRQVLKPKKSPVVLYAGSYWEDENEKTVKLREVSDAETLQKLVFDRYGGEFLNTLKKFQLSLHPPKELNMTETEIFLNGWKPKYSKICCLRPYEIRT